MGKNRKKGSRAFTPAVSKEKNNLIISNFISSVISETISDSIKLASVNKSLGDARWEVSFYTKNNSGAIVEHIVQCIKAGNLSRRGALITPGSIVIIDNIGSNIYQIVALMSRDDIREFKKIDSDIFWVPEKLFNIDSLDDNGDDGILFEEENDEQDQKVPYKRKNIINKDVIPKPDEDEEIVIDDI